MNPSPATGGSSPPRSGFPTTHWSVVLSAGAATEPTRARAALETLCRQYWFPLYAFARRQGHTHHEAEDCTQEFLARLLAADGIGRARPERGRFRTFMLTAFSHFLTNEWRRTQARRRGGGSPVLSLDLEHAKARFEHEPIDPGLTPQEAFDESWARALFDAVIAELREEYGKSGRSEAFVALAPFLWGGPAGESHAASAARIGMKPEAFTMALHRLRHRVGDRLRIRVAETVDGSDELDAELRHLITSLSRRA